MRIAFLAAAALVACAPAEQPSVAAPTLPDSAATMAAAEALAQRYTEAWLARDMASLGDTFAETATAAFLGFPTTSGRPAIQALYAAAFEALGAPRDAKLTVTSAQAVAPEVMGILGTSRDTFDSSGTNRTTWWRWAGTARQEPDGQWRFTYLIGFPDSVTRSK